MIITIFLRMNFADWNAMVSWSNITKNNFLENTNAGLHFYGSKRNRIFENNIIENNVGLDYYGPPSSNNTLSGNYWNNYRLQIDNHAGDAISGVDQSPVIDPISNSFDPSNFSLPTIESKDEPQEEKAQNPFPTALVIITTALTVAFAVGLFAYAKKHNTKRNTSTLRQAQAEMHILF